MEQRIILSTLVVLAALGVVAFAAGKDEDDYIKVEIQGTLETGIVAIGGETTGTIIRVDKVTWELDLGGNKDFEKLAKKLHKKTARVTGTYRIVEGVEIPERHIVTVEKLEPTE